ELRQQRNRGDEQDEGRREERQPDIGAEPDWKIRERSDRIDDELDLARERPPGLSRQSRLLVVLDELLPEPEPRDQREHADVPLRKAAERVEYHAIEKKEIGTARRHLGHPDEPPHDPVIEGREPAMRSVAGLNTPRGPHDLGPLTP